MRTLINAGFIDAVRTRGFAQLRAATRRRIREAKSILRQPVAVAGPINSASSCDRERMKRRLHAAQLLQETRIH